MDKDVPDLVVTAYLSANSDEQSFTEALAKGWEPSLAKMIDLWQERNRCDPEESLENLMDWFLHLMNTEQVIDTVMQFFEMDAANYLIDNKTSDALFEIAADLERRAVLLRDVAREMK